MKLAAKIHDVRTALSHRRTMRLAQRQLSDELATFATEADRAELDTILDRYPAEQTEEIRMILQRQDTERQYAAKAIAGLN